MAVPLSDYDRRNQLFKVSRTNEFSPNHRWHPFFCKIGTSAWLNLMVSGHFEPLMSCRWAL